MGLSRTQVLHYRLTGVPTLIGSIYVARKVRTVSAGARSQPEAETALQQGRRVALQLTAQSSP
jgi:hypothetical protein